MINPDKGHFLLDYQRKYKSMWFPLADTELFHGQNVLRSKNDICDTVENCAFVVQRHKEREPNKKENRLPLQSSVQMKQDREH